MSYKISALLIAKKLIIAGPDKTINANAINCPTTCQLIIKLI